jgi:hypothetical protein
MEKKEIISNFSKPITFSKINNFLTDLSQKWIFKKINIKWNTKSCVSVNFILNKRDAWDSVKIFILEEGKQTKVLIEGEKFFTVEFFFFELEKII